MSEPSDDRSSLAMALAWASMVSTIALEMALPALLGHWLDKQWGTRPYLFLFGTVIGFTVGLTHLLRWSAKLKKGLGAEDHLPESKQEDHRNREG